VIGEFELSLGQPCLDPSDVYSGSELVVGKRGAALAEVVKPTEAQALALNKCKELGPALSVLPNGLEVLYLVDCELDPSEWSRLAQACPPRLGSG